MGTVNGPREELVRADREQLEVWIMYLLGATSASTISGKHSTHYCFSDLHPFRCGTQFSQSPEVQQTSQYRQLHLCKADTILEWYNLFSEMGFSSLVFIIYCLPHYRMCCQTLYNRFPLIKPKGSGPSTEFLSKI